VDSGGVCHGVVCSDYKYLAVCERCEDGYDSRFYGLSIYVEIEDGAGLVFAWDLSVRGGHLV
jgi:hypothetical protein